MNFTNSPLVDYTLISPNRHSPRKMKIDTITIHCVVGQATVESLGRVFYPESRQASSNYGVGTDGKIGMYCEEKDRSWCSSSPENDHRAITIEVASDNFHPYYVNDRAMEGLIKLLVDICVRNEIPKLLWKNDPRLIGQPDKQNMTVHRWFAATICPGKYLMDKMGWIAEETNKRLELLRGGKSNKISSKDEVKKFKVGDLVKILSGSTYYNGVKIPNWVQTQEWHIKSISGDRAVLGLNKSKTKDITSPVNVKSLILVSEEKKPYTVKITTNLLNIRSGAGTNYSIVGQIKDRGIYTIIEEKDGWGKLKSGVGWISLYYTKKL